jgi:3-phenylpropionate/trans-cinnamate dioxygenase ferredoxin subunit
MAEWLDVAKADELLPGEYRVIDIEDVEIALINCGGRFYAIEDVCTHDGGELTGGEIKGCEIECPRHGARFSIETGEALTPPAYEPVATFPVRVENGMVQVRDDRFD